MRDDRSSTAAPWGCEQLVLCRDDTVGLRAVIAIDDTTLGPGLGGVRLRRYPKDSDAIVECQRLAAAMTLKNAFADVPFGGAKAVIADDGALADRPRLMQTFGTFVARTGGAYLPGVDMGTTPADLAQIGSAGVEVSCSRSDPSPWTALGVIASMQAALAHVDGRAEFAGVRVLVQGAGHVGRELARQLARHGAELLIADVDAIRAATLAREVDGVAIPAAAVVETPCDVFAPCAAAQVVSPETVERLACRVIVGAANDTLSDRRCADLLAQRGIVYVPDFVANAGGVIHIHAEREGWLEYRLRRAVLNIGDRAGEMLAEAARADDTPLATAEAHAVRRLATARAAPPAGGVPPA